MVMLALVVLGLFSYRLLPVEQMPEVNAPQVFITVSYPGASPEAMETDVLKPIENVINSVNGVKNIFATAREGTAFMQCVNNHLTGCPSNRLLQCYAQQEILLRDKACPHIHLTWDIWAALCASLQAIGRATQAPLG